MRKTCSFSAVLLILLAGCSAVGDTQGYTELGEVDAVTVYGQLRSVDGLDHVAVIAKQGSEKWCDGVTNEAVGASICGTTIDERTYSAFVAPSSASDAALVDREQGGEVAQVTLLELDGVTIAVAGFAYPLDDSLELQYSLPDGSIVNRYGDPLAD